MSTSDAAAEAAASAALQTAAGQLLALQQELQLSNVRFVTGINESSGGNAVQITPVPAVAAYGPDLVCLVDVGANGNTVTNPVFSIDPLPQLTITARDGQPVNLGDVVGTCLFGFSSIEPGGYAARLLVSNAQLTATEGVKIVNGQLALAFEQLVENDAISGPDLLAFYQSGSEGGQNPSVHRKITMNAFLSYLNTALQLGSSNGNGGSGGFTYDPSTLNPKKLVVEAIRAPGVNASNMGSSSSTYIRWNLNTVSTDELGISLSGGVIQNLPPGTYDLSVYATAHNAGQHNCMVKNESTGAIMVEGSTGDSWVSGNPYSTTNPSVILHYVFSIASNTNIALYHRNGAGGPGTFGDDSNGNTNHDAAMVFSRRLS